MNFADKLTRTIQRNNSVLCAGIDPRLDTIPHVFTKQLSEGALQEDAIYKTLTGFFCPAVELLADKVACIKPNIAFFEALGIPGLRALGDIVKTATAVELPTILDAKRGDIGSTAHAYARAYFGTEDDTSQLLDVDSLTVNAFMGSDSIEPFLTYCGSNKGIFVLVKTSNPGSGELQGLPQSDGSTLSEHVARLVHSAGLPLRGQSGYSSVGAVVGATYPAEAIALRKLMPHTYFLIPGFGSQGGKATDAVAGFDQQGGGAIVNASRGLFSSFSNLSLSREDAMEEIAAKAQAFSKELNDAVTKR